MAKSILRAARVTVYRWLILQIIVVIVASLILLFMQGTRSASSVLLGGAVCVLPQYLFARRVFSYYRASAPARLIRNFYWGEIMKLLLTAVLFVLVISLVPVKIGAVLIGFISAQLVFWIMPLVSMKS